MPPRFDSIAPLREFYATKSDWFILPNADKDTMKNIKKNILTPLRQRLTAFHQDTYAATSTEYIILLILIACFVIAIVKVYGSTASKKFRAADEKVTKQVTF